MDMNKHKCLVCKSGNIISNAYIGFCDRPDHNLMVADSHYSFALLENKIASDKITTSRYIFTRYRTHAVTWIYCVGYTRKAIELDYILFEDGFDINQVDEIIDNLLILS